MSRLQFIVSLLVSLTGVPFRHIVKHPTGYYEIKTYRFGILKQTVWQGLKP